MSSSEDDLPAHQSSEEDVSSDDWRSSDYSPPWSSEKEDPEEDDEDDADDSDSDTTSTHLHPSERGEHERIIFRLSSL